MDINIRGLSTFFLFAIPAVLGLAAIYWLFFVRGVIDVRRGMVMDSRHNEIVGAAKLPRGAVQMVIAGGIPNGPVIERAEIYGANLTVWVRNDGDKPWGARYPRSIKIIWKAMSPDGTVIASDDRFCGYGVDISPMQVAEFKFSIEADKRMERLELSLSDN